MRRAGNEGHLVMMRTLAVFVLILVSVGGCAPERESADNAATASAGGQDLLPLTLFAMNRSLTRLAVIVAWDQGLYEKYGLKLNLLIPGPDFARGREIPPQPGMENAEPEMWLRGATPMLIGAARAPAEPHLIDIGGIDCNVRVNIIGRMGIDAEVTSLKDLRGKRIGVANPTNTLGFQARLLAQRMGWDYRTDITIVDAENDGIEELAAGTVDAIMVNEMAYSEAKRMGFPVLFDTGEWNEAVGGNSVAVDPVWLQDPVNREKARRFLMALSEGIAILRQHPDVARRVLREWNGVQDDALADDILERSAYLSREPFPCAEGLQKTIELFPEIVPDQIKAEDFYDNSIMEEIDASGFLDTIYR